MLDRSHRNNIELMEDFDRLMALYQAEKHKMRVPVVGDEKYLLEGKEEQKAIESLEVTLKKTKIKLKSAENREVQIKAELKLRSDATHRAVLDRIHEYRVGKTLTTKKLNKLKLEYLAIKQEKFELQRKLADMESTKVRIELTSGQRQEDEGREIRKKQLLDLQKALPHLNPSSYSDTMATSLDTAVKTVDRTPHRITQGKETKRKHVQTSNSHQPPLARTGTERHVTTTSVISTPIRASERCVLCRGPFPPLMSGRYVDYCHIHYNAYKDGKWGCCGGGSDSMSCLRMPHLRVEIGAKHSICITDGMRKLFLD